MFALKAYLGKNQIGSQEGSILFGDHLFFLAYLFVIPFIYIFNEKLFSVP